MKGKIFNAQEVQAILAGNKTMFREVIKPQPLGQIFQKYGCWNSASFSGEWISPYQVGQKIFVKEDFRIPYSEILYDYYDERFPSKDFTDELPKWANGQYDWHFSAQHMKQEHSRLTLLIKSIGVERLADISETDCCNEGFGATFLRDYKRPRFIEAWNATHKKPEEQFEANPWVWSIQFEVINNISQT